MTGKPEALQQYIRSIIMTEVKELVPILVREVMANMLMEVAMNAPIAPLTETRGNSHKRKALQEYDNDEPVVTRSGVVEWDEPIAPSRKSGAPKLIVSEAHSYETGRPIPIDSSTLPDHVVRALSRTDYGDVLKLLDSKTRRG